MNRIKLLTSQARTREPSDNKGIEFIMITKTAAISETKVNKNTNGDSAAINKEPYHGLAIITGASSGIGRATAKALAQGNYDLLLFARRETHLIELQSELAEIAPERTISIFAGDIRNRADIEKFIKTYETPLKNLSVLINNAGLAKGVEPFAEGNIDDWNSMIDTNITGLLTLTRMAIAPMLEKRFGHIVNLGSVAGRWVYPGGTVYCATKFAVRAITEGLRQDLSGSGIRVTNIEPGMVETEFSLVRLGDEQKAREVYQGMTPLCAEDIAETITWCLSRPAHVNIQELVIYPTAQAAVRQVHRE